MRRIRVIPVLMMHKGGLYKSVKFKDYKYLGDPINAVKLFNDKEVDELALIDVDASREGRGPDIPKITEIAGEAFMPMAYGGGISNLDQVKEIFYNGIEKVILNKAAFENPSLIGESAKLFGSQSIVVSIDYKKQFHGKKQVYILNGKTKTGFSPEEYARKMEQEGAGELIINSIDHDGTFSGYDLETIDKISSAVKIPVVALGGAGSVEDFSKAVEHGASAVAAGSMFVFKGPHRAVLVNYPSQTELKEKLYGKVNR